MAKKLRKWNRNRGSKKVHLVVVVGTLGNFAAQAKSGGAVQLKQLQPKDLNGVFVLGCLPVCVCSCFKFPAWVSGKSLRWARMFAIPPALCHVHHQHVDYMHEIWHRRMWDAMYRLPHSSFFPLRGFDFTGHLSSPVRLQFCVNHVGAN